MKIIKNSDIKFRINKKLVYLPNFTIRFYTVNQKEYFLEKTQDDLVEYEREATVDDADVILSGGTTVTEYYLPLNWHQLMFVGKGVLNYKLTNNIEDPEFPDYQFNKEEIVTTDFYIDSIEVDPEPEEGLIERIVLLEKHLAEEIVNREQADATITENLNAEANRAISAETALDEKIDAEETRATTAENELDTKIGAETTRATAAEAALDTKANTISGNVITETTRATAKEDAISGKLDTYIASNDAALQSEVTRATTAEEALQTAITNEVSRASEAESGITDSLNAEVTRATSAEAALDVKIDTVSGNVISETSRATTAENALSGAIDSLDVRFFDDAKYEDSGNTKVINFYNGNTIKATIDASDFIVDGMVEDVRIENGYLVIDFNTASGKQDISIPLTDIFDPSNYYTKSETSGATEIATALAQKLAISDFNTYSGAVDTLINSKASQSDLDALNGVVTAHTADTTVHVTTSDKTKWNKVDDKLDVTDFNTYSGTVDTRLAEDEEVTSRALNALNEAISGKVDRTTYNTYTAATETALNNKADTSAVTAVQNSLSGYVYTADLGKQDIFGSKTFIGAKKLQFTQAKSSDKLGFTLYDARDEQGYAKEFAAFELNPTGITENSVTHPLLTLNHYRNNSGRDVQTYIGYRQYDQPHSAAYHLLAPLPENAKTPFNLTTTFQNYYFPLGFRNGSTIIKADNTGVVNLSSELGGLKLVMLTQAEYDALATKDNNTLYVIVG